KVQLVHDTEDHGEANAEKRVGGAEEEAVQGVPVGLAIAPFAPPKPRRSASCTGRWSVSLGSGLTMPPQVNSYGPRWALRVRPDTIDRGSETAAAAPGSH